MNDDSTGKGRLFLDPAKYHDDLRLLHMAIRQRWEISDEFKAIALSRLKSILETGDDEIAMKAITEARHMEAQNQKDEHKNLDEFSQLVIDIAAREGVDVSSIGFIEEAEDASIENPRGVVDTEEKRTR